MQINVHPDMEEWVLERLTEEYSKVRKFPSSTELIYCLTRSYYDRVDPLPITRRELLLFSVGWGMERVMITPVATEPKTVDGIHLSPDFMWAGEEYGELKTTRMKPPKLGEKPVLSEGWVKQIMGYCWAEEVDQYGLAVIHIFAPDLKCWQVRFEVEELEEHWKWMLARKDILVHYMGEMKPPPPFTHNMDWECTMGPCRYKSRCDLEKIKLHGVKLPGRPGGMRNLVAEGVDCPADDPTMSVSYPGALQDGSLVVAAELAEEAELDDLDLPEGPVEEEAERLRQEAREAHL